MRRSLCSLAASSMTAPILLRPEHFVADRAQKLQRNERSIFAAPERRRRIEAGKDCATLVLLVQTKMQTEFETPEGPEPIPGEEEAEESWVLFTQRAKRMSKHANEIAFPGGNQPGG